MLAKLLAIDTGTRLWDEISSVPLDELRLSDESRSLLQRGLFLKPLPFVRRVVFIATPQRGSYVSGFRIAHWVGRLVRLPVTILAATADVLAANPNAFPNFQGQIGSVYGMTPGSPLVKALAPIPVAPGVAVHSIVAVKGEGPPEGGNDGVVEYASAHLEKADSELVVRSSHSTQSNPHTIEEVRRILLLHAAEACTDGAGCAKTLLQTSSTQ